jgi:hypothetical protein
MYRAKQRGKNRIEVYKQREPSIPVSLVDGPVLQDAEALPRSLSQP